MRLEALILIALLAGCATTSDNPRNMMNMTASQIERELARQLP